MGLLRFAWWSLRGHWEHVITLCLSFVCIVLCVSLLGGFTSLATLTALHQVSHSWRTPYDLLVRAPDALSPVERQLKTVDPGTIEQTYGGITQEQVATVAHLAHVAVAAPEATVGWITLHPYMAVSITQSGFYRITTTLTGADGTHVVDSVHQVFVVVPLAQYAQFAGQISQGMVSAVPLARQGPTTLIASWSLPTLLTGIDPTAEANLVGLAWHPIQTGQNGLPLLMDMHPWTALHATLQVEQAPISSMNGMLALLQHQSPAFAWHPFMQKQLDASMLLAILASELRQTDQPDNAPSQGGGVTRYARVMYTLAAGSRTMLTLASIGRDSSGVVTRLLLFPDATTPWVALKQSGGGNFSTFDATKLPGAQSNAKASVPLGLYYPTSSTLAPTLWAQYAIISWPPLLFTTVQAACALTGKHCISAIRVRVADLGPFGARSESLLRQVALDIEKHTGLHVDILTGASGQVLLVQEEASNAIMQPFSEIWIQPYAALTITSGVNEVNIALLVAVLSVAGLALVAAGLLAAQSRQKDIALLADTGWTPRLLWIESVLEAGMIASLALLPAGVCVWLVEKMALPIASPMLIAGVAAAAALLYSIVVAVGTSHMSRQRTRTYSTKRKQWTRGDWWWMMLIRQWAYRRGSAFLVVVATAGACGVVCFMVLVQSVIDGILYATLLGQQVQVSLSFIHVVIAILTCVSALLTVTLTLLLVVRERSQEFTMLLSLGWTRRTVMYQLMREGALLGLYGGLAGGCAAVLILSVGYQVWSPYIFMLSIVGTAVAGLLVGISGVGYPAWKMLIRLQSANTSGAL